MEKSLHPFVDVYGVQTFVSTCKVLIEKLIDTYIINNYECGSNKQILSTETLREYLNNNLYPLLDILEDKVLNINDISDIINDALFDIKNLISNLITDLNTLNQSINDAKDTVDDLHTRALSFEFIEGSIDDIETPDEYKLYIQHVQCNKYKFYIYNNGNWILIMDDLYLNNYWNKNTDNEELANELTDTEYIVIDNETIKNYVYDAFDNYG